MPSGQHDIQYGRAATAHKKKLYQGNAMKLDKALVLANGIVFIGFGLGFMFAPVYFSTSFEFGGC